ncbi:hypothetical protein PMIN04_013255 [Paraphaeosphaeria minitans]
MTSIHLERLKQYCAYDSQMRSIPSWRHNEDDPFIAPLRRLISRVNHILFRVSTLHSISLTRHGFEEELQMTVVIRPPQSWSSPRLLNATSASASSSCFGYMSIKRYEHLHEIYIES